MPIPQRPVDYVLKAILDGGVCNMYVRLSPIDSRLLCKEIARLQAALPDYRSALERTHNTLCIMAKKHGEPLPPSLPERNHDEIELLQALESAQCIIRQMSRATYGEELTPKEFADRMGYDS